MPDCRKSHLIFQNFLGMLQTPAVARFGASPLSKIPVSAPGHWYWTHVKNNVVHNE